MSLREEIAQERLERVSIDWSRLKKQGLPQLLLRFGFGACIAAVASLTGVLVG